MKWWQVAAIVAVAVFGVALVVYFATRREPTRGDANTSSDEMGGNDADTVEGVGNALTGLATTITRAAS